MEMFLKTARSSDSLNSTSDGKNIKNKSADTFLSSPPNEMSEHVKFSSFIDD